MKLMLNEDGYLRNGKRADTPCPGTPPKKKATHVIRRVKAWADVGSHGHIFAFESGPVASHYPRLLHVYARKMTDDLIPVTITYRTKRR